MERWFLAYCKEKQGWKQNRAGTGRGAVSGSITGTRNGFDKFLMEEYLPMVREVLQNQ